MFLSLLKFESVHVYICMFFCMCVSLSLCMGICLHVCACMRVCVCARLRKRAGVVLYIIASVKCLIHVFLISI